MSLGYLWWIIYLRKMVHLHSLLHSHMLVGWKFSSADETPGCIPDPFYNSKFIKELYFRANPDYSARFTVPVLWDTKTETIVNNESSEIIRMLNSEFNDFATNPGLDLYPEDLHTQIDATNEWVYDMLNNGVYKSGFATSQAECTRLIVVVFIIVVQMRRMPLKSVKDCNVSRRSCPRTSLLYLVIA